MICNLITTYPKQSLVVKSMFELLQFRPSLVSTKVFLAEMIGRHGMQLGGEDLHFRKRIDHGSGGDGCTEQIR